MAYICATCFFDTSIWDYIKRAVINYGYERAASDLAREGYTKEAARLRNEIKIGGIN